MTLTDCPRLPVSRSDRIRPSVSISPTSVGKVSLNALYKEGWRKTGTISEKSFTNFRSTRDSTCAIRNFGKESLAAGMKSQSFVPAILITVTPSEASLKFLGPSVDLPSTDVNLNKSLKMEFLQEELSLSSTYLSTRQMDGMREGEMSKF